MNSLVLVAVGSNLGDREANIQQALDRVSVECGEIVDRASVFETKPIGECSELFLNSAFICQTKLTPKEFLKSILNIEKEMGRTRSTDNREIDLDILLWRDDSSNSITSNSEELLIPHPEMLKRDFVLVPASEIAGEWLHPVGKKTLKREKHGRGFELSI